MKKPVVRITCILAMLLAFGAAFGFNASSVHAATISTSTMHISADTHLVKHTASPMHTHTGLSANAAADGPKRMFDCNSDSDGQFNRDGHFNILSGHGKDWYCFEGSGTLTNLAINGANLVCTGNHTGTVTWYAGNNNYIVIPFPTKNVCSPLDDALQYYVMVTEITIDPS